MLRVLRTPELPVKKCAGSKVLLLDADRTLGPTDSGRAVGAHFGVNGEIRHLFETFGYSAAAFEAVAQVWSRIPKRDFLSIVEHEARQIELHPAWSLVLEGVVRRVHVEVVTAGIPQIWRHVLRRNGFGDIHVWGGCHASLDSHAIDPESKAAIVRAHQERGCEVTAAGDSEVDLAMLQVADVPLFVADGRGSPRLLRRLPEIPGICHFRTDHQQFDGIPAMTADQLLAALLTAEGGLHAPRPNK